MKKLSYLMMALILISCHKENFGHIQSQNVSDFQSDGIISVESSILPPATSQTFLANGQSSKAIFQIVASDSVTIEAIYFSGQYPLIQYITAKNIGVAVNHPSGQMGLIGIGRVDQKGIKLPIDIFYSLVDSSISSSVAQLAITSIQYETNTGIYHSFDLNKPLVAQPVCLVNNIPHILLAAPDADSLNNGYKQIIKLKLTGDTSFRLKKLPLNLSSPFIRTIKKSQLIVKHDGQKIAFSDTIKLDINSSVSTVIDFGNGFKHTAGQTEVIKIFANTPTLNKPNNPIISTLHPIGSLVWFDGLNAKLSGQNGSYFKEETGQSIYDEK